ncbi:MAG: hypothetical protein M0R03_17770 [Novosphingobium sp.]|nr:hypothetical protein [Novosphingobium sp.]
MLLSTIALAATSAGLSGCATTSAPPAAPLEAPAPSPGVAYAGIGETVYVDGPKVTPLEVIEDSRCPQGVQCVWAGRVRLSVRIDLGSGSETRELVLHRPEQVADGTLELVEVWPPRAKTPPDAPPKPWRFGFRFMGGL